MPSSSQVERLLQINITAMVLLGVVLLSMGERSSTLPMWMTVATVVAFVVTDLTGRFALNRTQVNIGAVVALLLSLLGLRYYYGLLQVYVIANLLVYLQVVLLFQKKEARVYRLLMLLSLLQVVVAAAFEQEVWFGILVFAYLFVGMSAMMFLYLYQEQLHRRTSEMPAAAPAGRRWPLAGQEVAFGSTAGGRAGLGRELFLHMARVTAAVAIVATLVFFVMPRVGHDGWRQAAGAPLRSVGFNDDVSLGQLGEIIEDAHEVMRVRLVDDATGELYRVAGPIYLRGAVLNDYRHGHWSCRPDESMHDYVRPRLSRFAPEPKLVRQEITIEPMERPDLFCVWPARLEHRDDRLYFDPGFQRVVRAAEWKFRRMSFDLVTPAFMNGAQVSVVPYDTIEWPPDSLTQLPAGTSQSMPGLIALAQKWIDMAGPRLKNRYDCAVFLEQQWRSAKEFQYSLEGSLRDPQLDPIEDFITKHRSGHCEYFATALALMLRSRGIPTRLVVGYKCDEWNELGQFFQVRQLHAHSWVEVYLGPNDVPKEIREAYSKWNWDTGGWLRLDPTPAASELSLTNRFLVGTDRYLYWLDYVWNNYIAEMNWARQRRAIYDPALKVVADTGRNLLDPEWWSQFFRALGENLHLARWFRWPVALGLLGAVAVAAIAYRRLRRVIRPYLRLWGLRRAVRPRRRVSQVEFYRRLEAILARQGLVRSASQTPRELAGLARTHLTQTMDDSQLAQLPGQLVETFYRVRFGGASLDRVQSQGVEQALRQLERAVRSTSHEDRTGRLQRVGQEHAL